MWGIYHRALASAFGCWAALPQEGSSRDRRLRQRRWKRRRMVPAESVAPGSGEVMQPTQSLEAASTVLWPLGMTSPNVRAPLELCVDQPIHPQPLGKPTVCFSARCLSVHLVLIWGVGGGGVGWRLPCPSSLCWAAPLLGMLLHLRVSRLRAYATPSRKTSQVASS